MIYLLKMVIFHGYVSHNQGVYLNFSEIKGLLNPQPRTRSRSAPGTRPFRSSLLWMACSWSFASPLGGHPFWAILFGATFFWGHWFLSNFCSCLIVRFFAPVCFLDCMDLTFVYAQHVFLVYACKVLICDGPRLVDVVIPSDPSVFVFSPHVCKKGNVLPWAELSWMTILREDSSGNIDNLVGLPSAMENGPFIDEFPIKTSIYKGFSMAMLNNQMVTWLSNHPKSVEFMHH